MKFLARFFAGVLISGVVLLALTMGGLRLAIINIEYFKSEIEYLLERDVASGIVFTGLDGAMDGFNPILHIDNVSITLPDRSQPLFIDRLEVEFNFWASLRARAPVVREISGKLEKLELVKDESGNWWISDLALAIEADRGPAPGFQQVLEWVPRYLKLDLNRLIVHDLAAADSHQMSRVSAQINHQKDQFFIRFGAELPARLGRSLLVKAIIGDDRSLIYVNSSDLRLTPVARLLDLDTRGLQQGALDGEVWINMSGFEVLAVNGNMVLKEGVVQMATDKIPLQVSYHSRFSAVNRNADWRITSWFDRLRIDDREVAGFRSQIEVGKPSAGRVVSAWVDRVPLESLPVIAGQWLPAEINEQIAEGHLDGVLQDVLLRIDLDRPAEFRLGARARAVSSHAFGNYPGATNLDAEILLGNNRFGARVEGRDVSLDFGDHFSAPLELDRLEFDAVGQRLDTGLLLALNDISLSSPDIEALGRAWLETDREDRPFAFIRASFKNGRGSSVEKYLPRKLMPLATQQWLERGIKQGFVPAGEMQFHGRLRDIRELQRRQAVEFFVDFRVEDAEVLFSPDWLPATNGTGRVLFHNVGVSIDLDRVSYDRIDNARARGSIADFRQPELNLHIETESSTADAVQSWVGTPVGKRFHEVVDNLHGFAGVIRTAIDVDLPLKGADPQLTTRVQVFFDDSEARSDNWGLQLSHINGSLEATGETLRARQIEARFFDDPVEIDIAGIEANGHTLVTAHGSLETRNLLRKLPASLTRGIGGKSDWRIRLDFSPESRQANTPVLALSAASNLEGSAIALPRPLDKAAADSARLAAEVDFFAQKIGFRTSFDDRLQSRGQLLGTQDGGFRLELLDLAFATDLAARPRPGLNLYGVIGEVSVDDWIDYFESSEVANSSMLQTVSLRIDKAQLFQREIANLQFDMTQQQQRFVGTVEAPIINGNFDIPRQPGPGNPAVIELGYLRIDEQQDERREFRLKPGDLIDFRLSSKVLLFHDMLFEDLLIHARATANRLYLDKLGLLKDSLELRGSGQWDYDPISDSHLSSITATVQGPGLGQAIDGIGFGDTMRNGTLDFQGGFTWPGPVLSLDLEKLAGDARLKIRDGVLNNVEPGSGRFVGLLSLSALPRRLSLDFSDVLIKGMEFSEISGTYRIEDGILYTRDTRMNGPAAKIKISGKTGITERNYDQTIRVTPKIGETLPVIGAISAGSTVGWGLLLLKNLFKKAIDDAVEVEYRVTGSWDDPKIELIKAVDENQRELPQIDR